MLTKRYNDLHEFTKERVVEKKIDTLLDVFEHEKYEEAVKFKEELKDIGFLTSDMETDFRINIFSNNGIDPIFEFSFTGEIDFGKIVKYYSEDDDFLKISLEKDDLTIIDGKVLKIVKGIGSNDSASPETVFINYSIYKPSTEFATFINNKRIEICNGFQTKLKNIYLNTIHEDSVKKLLEVENNWWSLDGEYEFKDKPQQYDYKVQFSKDLSDLINSKEFSAVEVGKIAKYMMMQNWYLNKLESLDIEKDIESILTYENILNDLEKKIQNILKQEDDKLMWWLNNPHCKCSFEDNLNSKDYLYSKDCPIHKGKNNDQ